VVVRYKYIYKKFSYVSSLDRVSAVMVVFTSLVCVSALVWLTGARRIPGVVPPPSPPILHAPVTPVTDKSGAALPPLNTTYFFDQLIDHNNPSRGTFKQRYYTT
jgi:hypothetical protein